MHQTNEYVNYDLKKVGFTRKKRDRVEGQARSGGPLPFNIAAVLNFRESKHVYKSTTCTYLPI